jgi:hypothetical protein
MLDLQQLGLEIAPARRPFGGWAKERMSEGGESKETFLTLTGQGGKEFAVCVDDARICCQPVQSIARWWEDEGRRRYQKAVGLLILADSGGSNGCQARAWKLSLQEKLCDESGLTVTICHYPTGCSKWNPIEHRELSTKVGDGMKG